MTEDHPGKRSGNVRTDDYTKDEYLQRLDRLIQRLQEDSDSFKFDKKGLGQLLAGLQQFMEDALGINAVYKPMPKLPARMLRNHAPDGPLYTIASECGKHMKAKNLKRIDWQNPSTRKENMDLLARIRQEFVRGGHLRTPRVFIHSSLGTNQLKLRDIVKKLGGETVQAADAAGVTHVLFPFGPKGDPDDGQHYMSTIEVAGPRAFVHWWYLPDSYDEWIPADTAPAEIDAEKKPKGPWKVYVRWLTDSEKYNEWMNEADYETEEAAAEAEASGAKRKGDQGQEDPEQEKPQTKQARISTGAKPLPEIEGDAGENIGPGVVKQQVVMPYQKAMAPATAVDISQGQRPEGSGVPQVNPPEVEADTTQQQLQAPVETSKEEDTEMAEPVPSEETHPEVAGTEEAAGKEENPAQAVSGGVPNEVQAVRQVYRIPASSSWFSWNTISPIEREACSDFFSGKSASRTAVLYREYRNAIINKYREDPSRNLDFTTVRKLLVGDVSAIREVYDRCLDWGLINYTSRQKPGVSVMELVVDGDRVPGGVRMSMGPNNDSLVRLPRHVRPSEAAEAAATGGGGAARVVARRNVFRQPTHEPPALANGVRYFCNAMPWVECTQLRYHCTKVPDVDLCPEAFAEGRFPPGCTAKDFVRLDATQSPPDPSGWTDQETLLLLEGLDLYGENWAEVAEHVGTKSQMQCILHFLQMPIEEQFLKDLGNTKEEPPPAPAESVLQQSEGGRQGEDQERAEPEGHRAVAVPEDLIPFADVGNPVMAQVAFLATMVGPRVAAAAAQRALEVLAEEDPGAAAVLQGLNGGSNGDHGAQAAEGTTENVAAPISSARLRTAAATALSAAAVKARVLADAEERECQRLVTAAIEAQFQKVQLKLQYLEQLDEVMVAERAQLEAVRAQHNKERMQLLQSSNQAQQVQQAAALQVAQLQQQAAMIQHSAAAQVQAAQHAASTVLHHQQHHPTSSAGGAASAHRGASS